MSRIFYSVAGEGRGHATRVRTVVEELRREHDVVLFAPHMAFDFLNEVYRDATDIEVRRIPGLQFSYSGRSVSYWKSIRDSAPYLWKLPSLVTAFEKMLKDERPQLVITDFEPALPRAARRLGTPFISFDHQHFLTTFDLASLPLSLRLRAKSIAATIDLFYRGQAETIVSSFFSAPLRPRCANVKCVGIMLRNELQSVEPCDDEFLLVYLRRFAPPKLMDALRRCGREVKIYGLGELPRDGNIRYFPISEMGFLDDLINCYALISNAGNQLVGEALSVRKPVLAVPEEGNFEQSVNAHFLEQSGYGRGFDASRIEVHDLNRFLQMVPETRLKIRPDSVIGNNAALAAIRRHLPAPVAVPYSLARVA